MSKSVVNILVVGDVHCGKSKFIQKFSVSYQGNPLTIEETYEIYSCKGTDHDIDLHIIKDISAVKKFDIFVKMDMILFSHTSEEPKTFQSLKEIWIPRLKKFTKDCLIIDNAFQKSNLTEEQVQVLKEQFSIVVSAEYSSEYKEVFFRLENILQEKSTQIQSASDACISDLFSEHLYNSNDYFTVEPRPNEFSTVEVGPSEHTTSDLSPNELSTDFSTEKLNSYKSDTKESILSDGFTPELSLKKRDSPDSISSCCSTVKLTPKKRDSPESISSCCSTVKLTPKKRYTVEPISSDCSTVELTPKKQDTVEPIPSFSTIALNLKDYYFKAEFSSNKCSTNGTNPDEFFSFQSRLAGRYSPDELSTDGCIPDHSYSTSPDRLSPVKLNPDAACSSNNFSSDELSREKLTPNEFSTFETNPDECFLFQSKSPGKYSSDEFSAYECTPGHSFPTSPDRLSPVKSNPDGTFSSNNFSSDESFPFQSRCPDKYSPDEFSADECTPDHSFSTSPHRLSPVKSNPDGAFSSNNFSSDESFPFQNRRPGKYSPDEFSEDGYTPHQSSPDDTNTLFPIESSLDATFSSEDFSSDESSSDKLNPVRCPSNKSIDVDSLIESMNRLSLIDRNSIDDNNLF